MTLSEENNESLFEESSNNEINLLQKELSVECKRFTDTANKYKNLIKSMYNSMLSEIVRKEYSVGGELIARGYYCPSPISDIIASNCNRGKILKRVTTRSKPSYEYCFDKNNRLLVVNFCHSNTVEILDYVDNDTVIGITFLPSSECAIISIVECIFLRDGRISSYIRAHSSYNDCVIDELEKEIYVYNSEGLYSAEVMHYLHQESTGTINYSKYRFKHNVDGYLEEYIDDKSSAKDDIYKVFVKRKV